MLTNLKEMRIQRVMRDHAGLKGNYSKED